MKWLKWIAIAIAAAIGYAWFASEPWKTQIGWILGILLTFGLTERASLREKIAALEARIGALESDRRI